MTGKLPIITYKPSKQQSTLPQITQISEVPAVPQKNVFSPFPIVDLDKGLGLTSIFKENENSTAYIKIPQNFQDMLTTDKNEINVRMEIEKVKQKIKEEFIKSGKRISKCTIEDITNLINETNFKAFEISFNTMLNASSEVFDASSLILFISSVNNNNKDLAEIMAKNPEFLTLNNLNSNTRNILEGYNDFNKKLVKWMCQNEKFTTKDNIGCIFDIMIEISQSNNLSVAEKLCKHSGFNEENVEYISDIIKMVDADNMELLEQILRTPELLTNNNSQYLEKILFAADKDNIEVAKLLCASPKYKNKSYIGNISYIIAHTNKYNIEAVLRILKDEEADPQNITYIVDQLNRFQMSDLDEKKLISDYEVLKKRVSASPERYINGDTTLDAQKAVDYFFIMNKTRLLTALMVFDKEAMDNLLRRRFQNAEKYLSELNNFKAKELNLLKKFVNSKNVSGKPLMPAQKVEGIDLIYSYKINNLDYSLIEKQIADDRVDLSKLKIDLFKSILKNCDFSEGELKKMSKEKIIDWNPDYIHLLPKAMDLDYIAYRDLLYAANAEDFMSFIFNENTIYGEANKSTKNIFEAYNMDFNEWLKPDKSMEMNVTLNKRISTNLSKYQQVVLDNINEMRKSPIKRILENRLKEFINDKGEFVIPKEYSNNEEELTEFIEQLLQKLEDVWQRAKSNQNIQEKEQTAKHTLEVRDNLEEMMKYLRNASKSLTIKMWDRIPQKDLFQGNYSTCCISIDGTNGDAMPHYLMNTAFNMIELIDNNSGKTIGNALCYFAVDEQDTPCFIIDNVEISTSCIQTLSNNRDLRNAIFEYAAKIAKKVTGKDIDVYLGAEFNDVYVSDLIGESKNLKFLGDFDCGELYMDLFKGLTPKHKFAEARYFKQK